MVAAWNLEETQLGDLKSFQARYIALRQQMFADGLGFGLPLHSKDLTTLLERVESEGASFAKVTLPQLGKALDQGLVSGHFACPANFRLKGTTRLPTFMFSLFREVFHEEDGAVRHSGCENSIQFLRQFLLFDSKLFTEPTRQRKEQAVDEFADRMRALRKVRIDKTHPVLLRAQKLLSVALAGLDLSDIVPGHGPGAVAEKLDRFARWEFNSWPAKAERYYPYHMYGASSLRAILERGIGIPLTKVSVTRCCLVPKDFKGPRLISAESTVTQYLQQGQMKAIMGYIARNPLLRASIKLNDQTFNQKAAQEAHSLGQATLDLSNASDTVSVPLVWFLLAGVPRLRRYLMATRSDYLRYEDRLIRIPAFAPMGSATCFPVETLVFWALAMASVELTSLHPRTNKRTGSYRSIARSVQVFGDDIILPSSALDTLVGTLLSVGCQPNMSKTCWKTPFRESCGSEWWYGKDVSLIRNRSVQYERLNRHDYPNVVDLQKKFFLRGYYGTAELLSEWANEIWPTPTVSIRHFLPGVLPRRTDFLLGEVANLDFFAREAVPLGRFSGLIGWHNEVPLKLMVDSHGRGSSKRIRFNRGLQRLEFRHPQVIQMTRVWESGGYPRLLARLLLDSSERIAIRDRKVKMAWSYLPQLPSFNGSQS